MAAPASIDHSVPLGGRHRRCRRPLWTIVVGCGVSLLLPLASGAGAGTAEPQPTSVLRRLQGLFSLGGGSGSKVGATPSGSPQQQQQPFPNGRLGGAVDAWATEVDLRAAQRLLDGDHWGLLGEMVRSADLDTIWGDPVAARRLLEANPILETLPGVASLAAKAPEEFTAEDVSGGFGGEAGARCCGGGSLVSLA